VKPFSVVPAYGFRNPKQEPGRNRGARSTPGRRAGPRRVHRGAQPPPAPLRPATTRCPDVVDRAPPRSVPRRPRAPPRSRRG
jgi:hypothetical protein